MNPFIKPAICTFCKRFVIVLLNQEKPVFAFMLYFYLKIF
jgi:hypothetical protein